MDGTSDYDDADALEILHYDLVALNESRLLNLDRLLAALNSHIEDFRNLLDRPRKNETSRQALSSGTFVVEDTTYSANEEFQQQTVQISDVLDLDEIESAKLLLSGQRLSEELDRTPLVSAIVRFHKRRHFLLECIRLTVKLSLDLEIDDKVRSECRTAVGTMIERKDEKRDDGSRYWRKCMSEMNEIEKWLQSLADRLQSVSMIGQEPAVELMEILDFQRSSLTGQHESLAAIASHLVEGHHFQNADFHFLLSKVKTLDKHDVILIHYVPLLICMISVVGSSDRPYGADEAVACSQAVFGSKDAEPWGLRSFHAAAVIWWLAEDNTKNIEPPAQGADTDSDVDPRTKIFMTALKDGAFQFMLSVSQDLRSLDFHDPGKHGLSAYLLQDTTRLPIDAILPSDDFIRLVMEQLQSTVDALISNMPDTLRKLKAEEDDQRRFLHSRFQRSLIDYEPHLERFLVIISYAFEGCPEAALAFWSDPEGNLFGFLQWASKRLTTPRAAAFCEMFRSISEGEECAGSAHRYLLEEGSSTSGKFRRTTSLSWNQIFAELQFYASGIKEKLGSHPMDVSQSGLAGPDQMMEPESAMMLESYLRLVGHLCRNSTEAREWIIRHPSFRLHEILFLLCGSGIGSRLRACSFSTLTSLLTNKSPEVGEGMWTALDNWIYGVQQPIAIIPKPATGKHEPARSEQVIFEGIASDVEEYNAFVGLLQALISSEEGYADIHGKLPFPEHLGTAYRMPGLDSYVDFVVGRGLGIKSAEVTDINRMRVLRLNCLTFMAACLASFNEELVVHANRSPVNVDFAIETSSLSAYVRFHPFARVMEWLFTDKVLTVLFATAHQDVEEVNQAKSDSPLLSSMVRSIEVMSLVMSLQPTYLDIVRPLVAAQSPNRRAIAANSTLVSFEDAVLNNLHLVVDLGLYCGTGHQDLTVAALQLLEKLSSSRKLVFSSFTGTNQRSTRSNRILGIMERNNDAKRISISLISQLTLETADIETGPISPGYVIKTRILDFLIGCLAASPERPSIAHLLLGFDCNNGSLAIPDDGPFARGTSLFHAVLRLLFDCPDGEDAARLPWLNVLKQGCMVVLRTLWSSTLASPLVMAELRALDFLSSLAFKQTPLNPAAMLDDESLYEGESPIADYLTTLLHNLHQRSAYFDYAARELRAIVQSGVPTLKAKIQSALLGLTVLDDGQQVQSLNLLDLFDFIVVNTGTEVPVPPLKFLTTVDVAACRKLEGGNGRLYDLHSIEQMLLLRETELRKSGKLKTPNEEEEIRREMQALLVHFEANNQQLTLADAKLEALGSWVQLMTVVLKNFDKELSPWGPFLFQTLQVVLPQLEQAYSEDAMTALELSNLVRTLIQLDGLNSLPPERVDGNNGDDKLSQLFGICVNGICSLLADAEIREACYQICYRYINGVYKRHVKGASLGRQALRTVKSAGQRLMEVICDDVYAGQSTCKISSLLFLEALVALEQQNDSRYNLEYLMRLNFIAVLVDGLKNIATELRAATAAEVPLLLSFYDASLALLLRVCQSRQGAVHVLSTGLFRSVRDSQIFSTDPDIGLEIQNPDALQNFFSLMLSVLRVINTAVLSRGDQSDSTITVARQFLQENRQCIVTIFKRNVKLKGPRTASSSDMDDLVDNFTLLMFITGFLEYEEKTSLHQFSRSVLS